MKQQVQKFGRFLSSMIMPNIGAFIAWGLITAFFIPTGWTPNEKLSSLVGPMITWLLPLLIAYSGGFLVAKTRGAVIGTIATAGLIVGASVPMFLGAMIMGPLAAWLISVLDKSLHGKIRAGFEMLVANFSLGILGFALALINVAVVGGIIEGFSSALSAGVGAIVNAGLLPLVSILVEPGKILFLNNAINHGVFTPLGAEQVEAAGKSILFLIETNPGPGMGIILAYMVATKGRIQRSTYGASVIHFLGGIHEIYFPYVLMRPILVVAVILGGMGGVITNTIFGNGLVGPPSPGSIFALSLLSTKGVGLLITWLSIAVAGVISFLVAVPLLRRNKADLDIGEFESAQSEISGMKAASKGKKTFAQVKSIIFACDAGMGSSAAGATLLQNSLKEAGLSISVSHAQVSQIPQDADLVVTQNAFAKQAEEAAPSAIIVTINNFMDKTEFEPLIKNLKNS